MGGGGGGGDTSVARSKQIRYQVICIIIALCAKLHTVVGYLWDFTLSPPLCG